MVQKNFQQKTPVITNRGFLLLNLREKELFHFFKVNISYGVGIGFSVGTACSGITGAWATLTCVSACFVHFFGSYVPCSA